MKLSPPLASFNWKTSIAQLFGVSRDVYYKKFGIPGHNGLDLNANYGEPVLAAHDGVVVGASFDHSYTTGSGIVLQQILNDGLSIQTTYWHLSKVDVTVGQVIKVGQKIGEVGNTGFVLPPPSATCPHCGTHLHFAVAMYQNGKPLFSDYTKGFQDPVPFLFNPGDKLPIKFRYDLYMGLTRDDVSWLQTCMALEGLAKDYTPIGYFGKKTIRDVIEFQRRNNITPLFGYVGPKTKALLNSKYAIA